MENLLRSPFYLLTVITLILGANGYRYICANRLCLCKVVDDGRRIRADCTKTPSLDHVPTEEFSSMEYSLLSFIDMTGTRYCNLHTPPTHDVSAHVVCTRTVIKEMQNPGLGTHNLGHRNRAVSNSNTLEIVIPTVAVVLLIAILTCVGVWIYKRDPAAGTAVLTGVVSMARHTLAGARNKLRQDSETSDSSSSCDDSAHVDSAVTELLCTPDVHQRAPTTHDAVACSSNTTPLTSQTTTGSATDVKVRLTYADTKNDGSLQSYRSKLRSYADKGTPV